MVFLFWFSIVITKRTLKATSPISEVEIPRRLEYSEFFTVAHPESAPPQIVATSTKVNSAEAMIAKPRRIRIFLCFMFNRIKLII